MRRLLPLLALASWLFFAGMAYFARTRWEGGIVVFWCGSAVFFFTGLYLIGAGVWNRQGRQASVGLIVLLPVVLCSSQIGRLALDEIGKHSGSLTFKVIDAETKKPIPNALVRLLERLGDPGTVADGQSEGWTDSDGSVSLCPKLIFTALHKPFRHSGGIRFSDRTLEVSAQGYQPVSMVLSELTGLGQSLFDPPPPPLTVQLRGKRLGENDP